MKKELTKTDSMLLWMKENPLQLKMLKLKETQPLNTSTKEETKTLHAEEGKTDENISLTDKFRKDQIIAQSSSIASLYQQIFTIQQNSMDFYFEACPSRSSTPALYQMKRLVDEIVSNFRRSSGITSSSSSSLTTLFQQKIIAFFKKEKEEIGKGQRKK
jgi:hypothetical protein